MSLLRPSLCLAGLLAGATTTLAQPLPQASPRLTDLPWNLDTIVHAGILSPDLANPDPTTDAFYGETNLDLSLGEATSLHALLDIRAQTIAAGESAARQSRLALIARPGLGLKVPVVSNFRLFGQIKQTYRWDWVRDQKGRRPLENRSDWLLEAGMTDWYRGAYWTAGLAHNGGEIALDRTPWQAMGYVHVDDNTEALSWGINGRGSADMLEFGLSLRFF